MKPGLRLDTKKWDSYIKKVRGKVDKDLEILVAQTTTNISYQAKRRVEFVLNDTGRLATSIGWAVKGKTGEVRSSAEYSPFVEFGTGTKVRVPGELIKYASDFKGKGLRKVNLPARPFFYPGFFIERAKFIQKLNNLIDRAK